MVYNRNPDTNTREREIYKYQNNKKQTKDREKRNALWINGTWVVFGKCPYLSYQLGVIAEPNKRK